VRARLVALVAGAAVASGVANTGCSRGGASDKAEAGAGGGAAIDGAAGLAASSVASTTAPAWTAFAPGLPGPRRAKTDENGSAPEGTATDPSSPRAALADGGSESVDEASWRTGKPRTARSIGHTSVVLKIELDDGRKAAWKPNTRRGPQRYRGEIAARRLALLLGLSNVPAAYPRSFEVGACQAAIRDSASLETFTREAIATGGVVKGALVPWIDGLEMLPLEAEPWRSRWTGWIGRGALEDADRGLAAQISNLVVFDFVTGNWDRWSGANVGIDRASGRLLYLDNDGAFFETPPKEALARNEKILRGVERFSRTLIGRLRLFDEATIRAAIGTDDEEAPLLSAKALAGVFERQLKVLRIVDAKIDAHPAEAVLAFP